MVHLESWDVERGFNGAVLVRMHSCCDSQDKLPDAVFTFRIGDPQYDHWKRVLDERPAHQDVPVAEGAGIR